MAEGPVPSGGAREALALLARIEARLERLPERREVGSRGGSAAPVDDVVALGEAVAALGERIAALEGELAAARALLEAIAQREEALAEPSPPPRPFPRDLFRIATQPPACREASPHDRLPAAVMDTPRAAPRTTGLPARLWPE